MASIPNLNTLRRGRGGPRLRGKGGGAGLPQDHDVTSSDSNSAAKDNIIQQTDGDASNSRLSAVELGYLTDEYAKEFLQHGEQIPRRYPIINRGTFVRTTAIDRLVSSFLQAKPTGRKQVISLGAGSDTRFFRLCGEHDGQVAYHELDFAQNANAKRAAIDRSAKLSARLKANEDAGCSYHLHAIDLRDLATGTARAIPNLDSGLPTLILSECCLCYLPPTEATAVLSYFMNILKDSAGVVIYEPIRPFDPFGKVMVSNLASRGIHLQTVKRYASLESQRQRLKLAGFTHAQGARDVHQIWESEDWVSSAERERIERVEWLDEVEEWKMLASHYCIAWASRGDVVREAWTGVNGASTQDEVRIDGLDLEDHA